MPKPQIPTAQQNPSGLHQRYREWEKFRSRTEPIQMGLFSTQDS